MPNAARQGDPIGHSPTVSWLVKGMLIGAAVGIGAVAVAGTGGLAGGAIIGGLVAGGAGIGEVLSTTSWAPKDKCGTIITGSPNVLINNMPAACAHVDTTKCSKHSGKPVIAQGSATVFINNMPAARINDKISCGAVIVEGSPNVIIEGGTVQTDNISPENLVPSWVHWALLGIGLASACILAGPVVAVLGLVGGVAGGAGGGWLGGKIFGEGSDGQKYMMLGGTIIGGAVGAKGGALFNKNYTITTQGLGSNLGNVKIEPKASGKEIISSSYKYKHNAPKNVSWTEIVESTKDGPAKYKYGTDIQKIEKEIYDNGIDVTNGKPWKVKEFDEIVGAKDGIETNYVRLEISPDGTVHSHPITPREFKKLTQ